jgi:hypothetical protein
MIAVERVEQIRQADCRRTIATDIVIGVTLGAVLGATLGSLLMGVGVGMVFAAIVTSRLSNLRLATACVWAGVVSFLATAIIPMLFFQFPGSGYMPFRYEDMWAVTEFLWAPLRILERNLDGAFSLGLLERLNPYFVAPFVNAAFAFPAVCLFLFFRGVWRNRGVGTDIATDVHSVIGRIEKVRADFPGALHGTPHPTVHDEATIEDARDNVLGSAYFRDKTPVEHQKGDPKR